MELTGNTVLITGGATGIGRSMAEYLLQRGNTVLICGRRQEKLDEARAACPSLHTFRCDVSREQERQKLLAYAEEHFPAMNFLINNAGIQREADLTCGVQALEGSEAELATNLKAPIWLSVLFTPFLKGKRNAAILHVSSGLGFASDRFPEAPVYSAAKAGLHAFAKAQRAQLAPLGVRVLEIIPPMVDTQLNPAQAERLRKMDPARFANPDIVPPPDVYVRRTFERLEAGAVEVKY